MKSFSKHQISSLISIINAQPVLFLEDINALVVSDLHLGIEAIMNEDGSFSPYSQTDSVINSIGLIIKQIKPSMLVLNGDVKHSFQEPSKIEHRDVKKFLGAVSKLVKDVHIIKGNHDLFLNWVAREYTNVHFHPESFVCKDYYFTHGDQLLPEQLPPSVQYVIIGHEHPIFEQKVNRIQKLRAPSFLLGPLINYEAKIIVMPAYTLYSAGTPITPLNQKSLLSPILRTQVNIKLMEFFVLGEKNEVFHFPELRLWFNIE